MAFLDVFKPVSDFLGKGMDKLWPDKTRLLEIETELAQTALKFAQDGKMAEFADIQQSRMLYAKELEKAPLLIRYANGIVRPFGGLGALATTFWVIWAPYFDYPPLKLPELDWNNPIWAIISGVISFFFVLRHKAQEAGVKDK